MMIVTDTVTPGPKYHFSFVDNQIVQLYPAQHAVLTMTMTHKRRFGIIRPVKSCCSSIIFES